MSDPEITAKLAARYNKWIEKKIAGKPPNVRAFLRCVYESGVEILADTAGVPVESLSIAGYMGGQYEPLRRMVEPLAAEAVRDPDQFLHSFHQRLNEISRHIQENSLYAEANGFFSLISRLRVNSILDKDQTGTQVMTVYEELLLAASRYLTPEKYDNSRLLCGCSTDGEPLYCDKYRPYAGEIDALSALDWQKAGNRQTADPDAPIRKYAAVYGYTDIRTYDDLAMARRRDAFHTEEILNISPYINEYTYDMLPDTAHIYNMDTKALEMVDAELDLSAAADALNARSRTLPANGIRYDFAYSPRIPDGNRLQSLTLKEISRGDRVVALYKLRYGGQDLCGYYDCGDRFFYSQYITNTGYFAQQLSDMIGRIVLYLYGAAVNPGGEEMVRDFGEHFLAAVSLKGKNRYPISVTAQSLGEDPRNTYADRGENV